MSVRLATIGHVAPDTLDGGGERFGGAALYTALAAQQLGAEVVVHTAGPPWLGERVRALGLEVRLQAAQEPTRFEHRGKGDERRLRITSWAGPMGPAESEAEVVILAPVAAELDPAASGRPAVLLPQGLIRRWDAGGWVEHAPAAPASADLVVAARSEAPFLAAVRAPVRVLTDGPRPARWIGAETVEVAPAAVALEDDVGAGDVFAAAVAIAWLRGDAAADALRFAHATVAEQLPRIHARLAGV